MSAHINAEKCIDYLRRIGIEIPERRALAWLKTEAEYREARRANRRELKKSCGHFATHQCTVWWNGGAAVHTVCNNCGKVVRVRSVA